MVQPRPEAGGLGSQRLGVGLRSHAADVQNSGAGVICVIFPPGHEALESPSDCVGVHRHAVLNV